MDVNPVYARDLSDTPTSRQVQGSVGTRHTSVGLEIFTALNSAVAWNVSGHMLSGSIAYHILRAESPDIIAAVQAILEDAFLERYPMERAVIGPETIVGRILSSALTTANSF